MLELVAFDDRGIMGSWISERFRILSGTTAVGDQVPHEFSLRLDGPSPSRGFVGLDLALPVRSEVTLRVFDARGRLVRELSRGELEGGWHRLTWDGTDRGGAPVPAGVYLARMTAGGRPFRVRIVLLR